MSMEGQPWCIDDIVVWFTAVVGMSVAKEKPPLLV